MVLEEELLHFLRQPEKEGFETLALRLYRHQRKQNSIYSRYCTFFGQSDSVRSWKEIPAVPQQAFKYSELRSFPADETAVEFRTSGTTGQGFGTQFLGSLRLYEAAVKEGWKYFGLPNRPLALLMQNPQKAQFSSLSRMGGILSNYEPDRFFVNDQGAIEIDRLRSVLSNQSEPLTLFGTALAFLSLCEEIAELPLPPGSILMETGGFKGANREVSKEELYKRLSSCFCLESDSIWNEYGMTELSSQFYSRGIGRPHLAPPWLRFMIIDPKTNRETVPGTTGLLRIFDLANFWSVLAVQTQDLAVAQEDGGFVLLGRDPAALPRGCSRAMDEMIRLRRSINRESRATSRSFRSRRSEARPR